MAVGAKGSRARISRPLLERAMVFKIGDVVRLKSGGAMMTVSKLFKSPEGREMVQCTWFDKPKEHRAAFVIDSLETAEEATKRPNRAVGADGGLLVALHYPTSSVLNSFRSITTLEGTAMAKDKESFEAVTATEEQTAEQITKQT